MISKKLKQSMTMNPTLQKILKIILHREEKKGYTQV
jgi:hypothetical protein